MVSDLSARELHGMIAPGVSPKLLRRASQDRQHCKSLGIHQNIMLQEDMRGSLPAWIQRSSIGSTPLERTLLTGVLMCGFWQHRGGACALELPREFEPLQCLHCRYRIEGSWGGCRARHCLRQPKAASGRLRQWFHRCRKVENSPVAAICPGRIRGAELRGLSLQGSFHRRHPIKFQLETHHLAG